MSLRTVTLATLLAAFAAPALTQPAPAQPPTLSVSPGPPDLVAPVQALLEEARQPDPGIAVTCFEPVDRGFCDEPDSVLPRLAEDPMILLVREAATLSASDPAAGQGCAAAPGAGRCIVALIMARPPLVEAWTVIADVSRRPYQVRLVLPAVAPPPPPEVTPLGLAASQLGRDDPITRAEAEAMTPGQLAARFLSGEVVPDQARAARIGVGWGATLGSLSIDFAPRPVERSPDFCRRSSYNLTFTPRYIEGESAPRLAEDVTFAAFQQQTSYSERAPGASCEEQPSGGAFTIAGDMADAFAAVRQFRTLARALQGGDAEAVSFSVGEDVPDEIRDRLRRASLTGVRPLRRPDPVMEQHEACLGGGAPGCYALTFWLPPPISGTWVAHFDTSITPPILHVAGGAPPLTVGTHAPPPPAPATAQ